MVLIIEIPIIKPFDGIRLSVVHASGTGQLLGNQPVAVGSSPLGSLPEWR